MLVITMILVLVAMVITTLGKTKIYLLNRAGNRIRIIGKNFILIMKKKGQVNNT